MKNDTFMRQVGRDAFYKIWHTPAKNMIMLVHSGTGSIVTKDRIYPLKEGTMCFIGADIFHYTMPDKPEIYERTKFFFSNDDLQKINSLIPDNPDIKDIFSREALIYSQFDSTEDAEKIFDEISIALNDPVYGQMTVYSALIKLMVILAKHSSDTISHHSNGMYKAIEYINNNIYNEITIDDICTKVHMSKYHFCRKFKNATGLTVMDYILKTRIVLAKNMLTKEKASVTEISNRCGFSSVSYFSRVFKRETGITPLKYRNEHN